MPGLIPPADDETAQLRAARLWLGLTQAQAGALCSPPRGFTAVSVLERGWPLKRAGGPLRAELRAAYEAKGVVFLDPGPATGGRAGILGPPR